MISNYWVHTPYRCILIAALIRIRQQSNHIKEQSWENEKLDYMTRVPKYE